MNNQKLSFDMERFLKGEPAYKEDTTGKLVKALCLEPKDADFTDGNSVVTYTFKVPDMDFGLSFFMPKNDLQGALTDNGFYHLVD